MKKIVIVFFMLQFGVVLCYGQGIKNYVWENTFKYSSFIFEGKKIGSSEYEYYKGSNRFCIKRDIIKVTKVFKGSNEYSNDIVEIYSEDCIKHMKNSIVFDEGPGKIDMEADTCVYFVEPYKKDEVFKDDIFNIQHRMIFIKGNQVALTIPNEYCNNCIPAYGKKFYTTNELRQYIIEMVKKTTEKK